MQLSVSSGKNSLIARSYFLAFGDSLDHSTDWPLADVVVSLSRWCHRVGRWLWLASGTWEFDDSNQTNLPEATTTLVNAQKDYTLPTTVFEIVRAEVLDADGTYRQLIPIDQSEIPGALSEFQGTNGLPKYYDKRGVSLFLYPTPATGSVTMAAGLKLYMTREMTEFSTPASYTTADTTQPGFDEDLHDTPCLGAAYDWCEANGPQDKAKQYRSEIEAIHENINKFYGMRDRDEPTKINVNVQRIQRNYI